MQSARTVNMLIFFTFILTMSLSSSTNLDEIDSVTNNKLDDNNSETLQEKINFETLLSRVLNSSLYVPHLDSQTWDVDEAVDYGYDDLSDESYFLENDSEEYPAEKVDTKKKREIERHLRRAVRVLNLRNKYEDPKVTAEYYDKKGNLEK